METSPMTQQNEFTRLRQLLAVAQQALSTCIVNYSEYNQFEGSWTADFSEPQVQDALQQLNQELCLPPPKSLRS